MRTLDPLSLKFAIFARSVHRETLDLGCGDGVVTRAVLERGGYVLAVDSDPHVLENLRERIPAAQRSRLRTVRAALPQIEFDAESFAAIHARGLSGTAAQRSLWKLREWLQPDGKLFLSTTMTASHDLRDALASAGFAIEEIEVYSDPDDPGAERCGVVARASSSDQNRAGSRSRATRP
jgi:SAM-dependent methyltransferase